MLQYVGKQDLVNSLPGRPAFPIAADQFDQRPKQGEYPREHASRNQPGREIDPLHMKLAG